MYSKEKYFISVVFVLLLHYNFYFVETVSEDKDSDVAESSSKRQKLSFDLNELPPSDDDSSDKTISPIYLIKTKGTKVESYSEQLRRCFRESWKAPLEYRCVRYLFVLQNIKVHKTTVSTIKLDIALRDLNVGLIELERTKENKELVNQIKECLEVLKNGLPSYNLIRQQRNEFFKVKFKGQFENKNKPKRKYIQRSRGKSYIELVRTNDNDLINKDKNDIQNDETSSTSAAAAASKIDLKSPKNIVSFLKIAFRTFNDAPIEYRCMGYLFQLQYKKVTLPEMRTISYEKYLEDLKNALEILRTRDEDSRIMDQVAECLNYFWTNGIPKFRLVTNMKKEFEEKLKQERVTTEKIENGIFLKELIKDRADLFNQIQNHRLINGIEAVFKVHGNDELTFRCFMYLQRIHDMRSLLVHYHSLVIESVVENISKTIKVLEKFNEDPRYAQQLNECADFFIKVGKPDRRTLIDSFMKYSDKCYGLGPVLSEGRPEFESLFQTIDAKCSQGVVEIVDHIGFRFSLLYLVQRDDGSFFYCKPDLLNKELVKSYKNDLDKLNKLRFKYNRMREHRSK